MISKHFKNPITVKELEISNVKDFHRAPAGFKNVRQYEGTAGNFPEAHAGADII